MAEKTEPSRAAYEPTAPPVTMTVDAAAWARFQALLDRPVSPKPRLAELLAEPPIFTDP